MLVVAIVIVATATTAAATAAAVAAVLTITIAITIVILTIVAITIPITVVAGGETVKGREREGNELEMGFMFDIYCSYTYGDTIGDAPVTLRPLNISL